MKIIYYAASQNMGDTPETDCEKFRTWALDQLETRFPEHDIIVLNEANLSQAYTDDIEMQQEIVDYCSRLWDRCPWDFG